MLLTSSRAGGGYTIHCPSAGRLGADAGSDADFLFERRRNRERLRSLYHE